MRILLWDELVLNCSFSKEARCECSLVIQSASGIHHDTQGLPMLRRLLTEKFKDGEISRRQNLYGCIYLASVQSAPDQILAVEIGGYITRCILVLSTPCHQLADTISIVRFLHPEYHKLICNIILKGTEVPASPA